MAIIIDFSRDRAQHLMQRIDAGDPIEVSTLDDMLTLAGVCFSLGVAGSKREDNPHQMVHEAIDSMARGLLDGGWRGWLGPVVDWRACLRIHEAIERGKPIVPIMMFNEMTALAASCILAASDHTPERRREAALAVRERGLDEAPGSTLHPDLHMAIEFIGGLIARVLTGQYDREYEPRVRALLCADRSSRARLVEISGFRAAVADGLAERRLGVGQVMADRHGPCVTCDAVASGMPREHAEARAEGWEADMMAEYGWYSHLVEVEPVSPTGFNAHTHGVSETWGHPDLQVVARLGDHVAHGILARVVEKIRGGARYSPGDVLENVPADGQRCTLVSAVECGRQVLRVILPDAAGHLEPTTMEGEAAMQYGDLAH